MTLPNPQVSSTCSNWVGSFILVRLPGLEPGASGLGDMFVELPAMSSHIPLCISTMLRLLSISSIVQYSQLSEPFITKVIVSKKLAAIFQTAN